MSFQSATCAFALAAALAAAVSGAQASDQPKYPDWKGQWERFIVRGVTGQPHKLKRPQGFALGEGATDRVH